MSPRGRIALALVVLTASCTSAPPPSDGPPTLLSEWGLFTDLPTLTPAPDVVPYDLGAPLFSDYAIKYRFMRLPDGEVAVAGSGPDGRWEFPVGTVLVKTFALREDVRDESSPEHIIETRLLVRTETRWEPYVYLWNEAGTDAVYTPAGATVSDFAMVDEDGVSHSFDYRVPNVVQCGNCHGGVGPVEPIGPRTEELAHMVMRDGVHVDQLDWLIEMGVVESVPDRADVMPSPFDETSGTLEERARAYLEAQCAHCHHEGTGAARQSGLWLDDERDFMTDPHAGRCKDNAAAGPGAGGRCVDIMPGYPDASIVVFRMESDVPGVRMPESGQTLIHTRGVALIREWIASLPPDDCGYDTADERAACLLPPP